MKIQIKSLNICVDSVYETLFIAEYNNEIIGTVKLGYYKRKSAYLCSLYVKKEFRRKSVASKLIQKCCETVINKSDCKTVGLTVEKESNIENYLEKLYEKLGFITVYEYDDKSILMVKILR